MAEPKVRVLVVTDDLRLLERLQDVFEAQNDLELLRMVPSGHDAIRLATELRPDIVLLGLDLSDMDSAHATWLIASRAPDSSVVLLAAPERADTVHRLLAAGAQGHLNIPLPPAPEVARTLRGVRQRAADRRAVLQQHAPTPSAPGAAKAPEAPHHGRRIALFSPKGGQGKTSVSVNLAVTLRTLTSKQVVLVDADLRFGDANILLDLPYERSVIDLLPHIDQLDSELLHQVLAKHSSGLHVLQRPERPELAEMVTAEHWTRVLKVLPTMFDYVIVDCEVSYDERLLSVLDHADLILLILTPNLGVVRNAKHFLQLAETLGYPREHMAFVLNRANSHVGLSLADVEWVLGDGRYFRLESAGQMLTASFNLGKPAVQTHPRSAFARGIREIADYLEKQAHDAAAH